MSVWAIIILAIALGTDSFSVCLGIGTTRVPLGKIFIMSAVVGIFHIFMPLCGLLLGKLLGEVAGNLASLIGALILVFLGVKIIYENVKPEEKEKTGFDCTSFCCILLLSLSVSLDALSIGFSLGTIGTTFSLAIFIFGFMAFFMSVAGLFLGSKLSGLVGKRAELFGGVILLILGVLAIF